jgi:hypothetical protein
MRSRGTGMTSRSSARDVMLVWYCDSGVVVIWIVLPRSKEVLVIDRTGERRFGSGETLPAQASLPGLAPRADDFFVQITTRP